MEKIPVIINQVTNIHGKKIVGVALDITYFIETHGDSENKLEKFKEKYFDVLKQAKKFIPKKGKRRKTKQFWSLSRLLQDFNSSIENEFFITNYQAAIQRDFELTDSYVGVIFQFGRYFNEDEVSDDIPMSYYFELTIKKRQLSRQRLWDKEKRRLIELGKSRKLPGHKEYRKELKNILQQ